MAGVLDALLGQEAGLSKLVQAQEANKIAREQLEINRAMAIAQGGGAAMLGLTGGAAIAQGVGNLFGLNPSAELQNVRNNPMQALGDAMQRAGIAVGQEGSADFMRNFFARQGMFAESEAAYEAGLGYEQRAATLQTTRQGLENTKQSMMQQRQDFDAKARKTTQDMSKNFREVRTAARKAVNLLSRPENPTAQASAVLAYAKAILGGGQTTPADKEMVVTQALGGKIASLWRSLVGGASLGPREVAQLREAVALSYQTEAQSVNELMGDRAEAARQQREPLEKWVPQSLRNIDPNELMGSVGPLPPPEAPQDIINMLSGGAEDATEIARQVIRMMTSPGPGQKGISNAVREALGLEPLP